ncbi:hypothetical protein R75465_08581 [Paraburkholderia aspalathi]|nr:hypothetical protein R75465_08581 [Paraburkholderia aspalathi]
MRLEFVSVQDTPHGRFAGTGQPLETRGRGMCCDIPGQRRERPQLGGQTQVFGLAACQIDHPRLGGLADLRRVRPVIAVLQSCSRASRQRLVDALVDRRARDTEQPLYLRGRLTPGIRQQHLGPLDLPLRRSSRTRQFSQHRSLFVGENQWRSRSTSCHAQPPEGFAGDILSHQLQ